RGQCWACVPARLLSFPQHIPPAGQAFVRRAVPPLGEGYLELHRPSSILHHPLRPSLHEGSNYSLSVTSKVGISRTTTDSSSGPAIRVVCPISGSDAA